MCAPCIAVRRSLQICLCDTESCICLPDRLSTQSDAGTSCSLETLQERSSASCLNRLLQKKKKCRGCACHKKVWPSRAKTDEARSARSDCRILVRGASSPDAAPCACRIWSRATRWGARSPGDARSPCTKTFTSGFFPIARNTRIRTFWSRLKCTAPASRMECRGA